MFNKDMPYNNLPLLPVDFNFDDIDILKLLNRANIALSELKGTARLLPAPALIFAPLSVKEAVASSGIENIHTTVSDAFEADVVDSSRNKEVLGYRDALIDGAEILKQNGGLSVKSIEKLQSLIEPTKKGLRNIPGVKIQNVDTKEIVYTPPDGELVLKEKLSNFEEYYNSTSGKDLDTLINMAILHYQFEAIHPFKDGNGRVGRIIMVLYLVFKGRLDLPILFLSGYILSNRPKYSKLLKGVTENSDWKSWILFILEGVRIQAEETTLIVMKIKELIGEYEDIMKKFKQGMQTNSFINYLFSNPYYTTSSLEKKLSIHRNTASNYLEVLEEEGILAVKMKGVYKIYYNKRLLDILK